MSETEELPERPEASEVTKDDLIGIFPKDSTWGNRLTMRDWEERKVDGHISPRVSDGDLFGYQMESGKVGVLQLINVDNCLDPRDQFFAEARDVGYLND